MMNVFKSIKEFSFFLEKKNNLTKSHPGISMIIIIFQLIEYFCYII